MKIKLSHIVIVLVVLAGILIAVNKKKTDSSDGGATERPSVAEAAPASKKEKSKKAPKESADTREANSMAISFHNKLLGFMGASRSPFKDISRQLKDGDEFVDRGHGSSKPRWGYVLTSHRDFQKIPTHGFAAPKTFSKEDQEFFNTRIQIVKDKVEEIKFLIDGLNKYYSAEDYKDDWHKRFLMDKVRMNGAMYAIGEANAEMFERSDAITEEIDRANLAKSPIGVYVLNMRYMLDKAKEQSRILLDPQLKDSRSGVGIQADERAQMIAYATAAADKVDAIGKEMGEMAEKYLAVDMKEIAGTKLEEQYKKFFTTYDKVKEDTRRIIRDLRERGYFNEQHTINSNISSLYKAHNNFIDTLNGK